jgi:hypothetical protein
MTLREYCELLKHCATVIEKNLAPFRRDTPEVFYAQGPGLGYSYIKEFKERGHHKECLIFNLDFSRIETELGNMQLCGTSILSSGEFVSYDKARQQIVQELGLIKKQRKIYNYSGSGKLYETYYELSDKPYPAIHTYAEIKEMWKKIN